MDQGQIRLKLECNVIEKLKDIASKGINLNLIDKAITLSKITELELLDIEAFLNSESKDNKCKLETILHDLAGFKNIILNGSEDGFLPRSFKACTFYPKR